MRTLLPASALVVVFSSVTLVGQTTLSIVTDGPFGAGAAAGAQSAVDGIPTGSTVGGFPNNLSLRGRVDLPTGAYASSTTLAYPTQPYAGGAGLNFFERAYARGTSAEQSGSVASAAGPVGAFGPHALLATFQAAPGTVGKIVFSYRVGPYATSTTSGSIDVGNDGTVEASGAGASTSQEVPFTFGPSGSVDVRITNECHVTGTGNVQDFAYAWTEIWVGFRPDLNATCTISSIGQGCNGLSESASETTAGANRVLNFVLSGAAPGSVAISMFGSTQLGLALPGAAGCTLLTNADVFGLVTVGATGIGVDTLVIPMTTTGRVYHQYLPLDVVGGNLVLATTNAIRVDCVR